MKTTFKVYRPKLPDNESLCQFLSERNNKKNGWMDGWLDGRMDGWMDG